MKRFSSKKIALAGVSSAISLIAVILSFYIPNLSLSLNVLAAVGIMLPLTQKYYREAILSYVAVCALGGIFANIHILPFVLIGGAYTIATIVMDDFKHKLKWYFAYPIKLVYACFVFFVLYYLTNIFIVNFEALNISLDNKALLYFILNVIFVLVFFIYDALLLWGYHWSIPYIERITRNLK
ncbi:MAG: hypothetical protein IJY07_03300 [Clostridia bacterium]|nr:hypothetical protein [Clostridia bacterium]